MDDLKIVVQSMFEQASAFGHVQRLQLKNGLNIRICKNSTSQTRAVRLHRTRRIAPTQNDCIAVAKAIGWQEYEIKEGYDKMVGYWLRIELKPEPVKYCNGCSRHGEFFEGDLTLIHKCQTITIGYTAFHEKMMTPEWCPLT